MIFFNQRHAIRNMLLSFSNEKLINICCKRVQFLALEYFLRKSCIESLLKKLKIIRTFILSSLKNSNRKSSVYLFISRSSTVKCKIKGNKRLETKLTN